MPARSHAPALPPVSALRLGVRTVAELVAAGWTLDAIRHAVATGRLVRVAAGRFAPPPGAELTRFQVADLALGRRTVAAALATGPIAASHLGAAVAHGWPIWATTPRPCVVAWDERTWHVRGLHLHRLSDKTVVHRYRSFAITAPIRTVVDIACEFGTEAGLVSGDAALARGEITVGGVAEEAAACRGLRGVAAARALAPLLDPLTESPLESRGRWQCHRHGITVPGSQVEIRTRGGRFVARVDHFWDEGVVGEVDGNLKYRDDPSALVREKRRQEALANLDLEVVRWGAADLDDFADVAARITRARARARRRLTEGDLLWRVVRPGWSEGNFRGLPTE